MDGEFGCYSRGGIEALRKQFPEVASIPFSSDIKFNLIIRDLKPTQRWPSDPNENYCVYMKGAPERIIRRCKSILLDGNQVVDINDKILAGINSANEKFGAMGERVLAFARYRLEQKYKRDYYYSSYSYPFDVKNWKSW